MMEGREGGGREAGEGEKREGEGEAHIDGDCLQALYGDLNLARGLARDSHSCTPSSSWASAKA